MKSRVKGILVGERGGLGLRERQREGEILLMDKILHYPMEYTIIPIV